MISHRMGFLEKVKAGPDSARSRPDAFCESLEISHEPGSKRDTWEIMGHEKRHRVVLTAQPYRGNQKFPRFFRDFRKGIGSVFPYPLPQSTMKLLTKRILEQFRKI
jgi:hypothetical protein